MENTSPITIQMVELLDRLPEDILQEIYEYNAEHRQQMKEVFRQLELTKCAHCCIFRPKFKMVCVENKYENKMYARYFCDDFCIYEEQLSAYYC